MKQRFSMTQKNTGRKNLIVTLVIFCIVIACFLSFWSNMVQRTKDEEITTLENALTRSISHCYAIEGVYPTSLQYLKDNYGLIYDEESFFVDYQPTGANIMPDFTIIVKDGDN